MGARRQAQTRNRECVSVSELPYFVHFHVENAPFVGLANLRSLLFLFPLLYLVANRDRSVRPLTTARPRPHPYDGEKIIDLDSESLQRQRNVLIVIASRRQNSRPRPSAAVPGHPHLPSPPPPTLTPPLRFPSTLRAIPPLTA